MCRNRLLGTFPFGGKGLCWDSPRKLGTRAAPLWSALVLFVLWPGWPRGDACSRTREMKLEKPLKRKAFFVRPRRHAPSQALLSPNQPRRRERTSVFALFPRRSVHSGNGCSTVPPRFRRAAAVVTFRRRSHRRNRRPSCTRWWWRRGGGREPREHNTC